MNFAIINLGCKVNRVESDSFGAFLLANNAHETKPECADLVIVNTCTVTGDAEKKTRKSVRKALREAPNAQIIVTGCAAVINPSFYEELDQRIRVIPKGSVSDYLEAYITQHSYLNASHDAFVPFSSSMQKRVGDSFPTRVAVKIQDGCNHSCTYCIVHTARGRAQSCEWNSVIDEVCFLEEQGVKEVVLTGIDLGSYYYNHKNLSDLLEALLDATKTVRFRISSIEPCSINEKLPYLIANSQGRICKHLHLPLQSGSNKVLKEMNRPYTREQYLALCRKLRKEIPNLSLTTDIIVGFPGEREEDFLETCSLSKEVLFSKIHVFRYSKREGTPAACRLDQISPAEKDKRAYALSEISDHLRMRFAQSLFEKKELVVIEKKGWGMTESYYHVAVPENLKPGSVHLVSLQGINSQGVLTL